MNYFQYSGFAYLVSFSHGRFFFQMCIGKIRLEPKPLKKWVSLLYSVPWPCDSRLTQSVPNPFQSCLQVWNAALPKFKLGLTDALDEFKRKNSCHDTFKTEEDMQRNLQASSCTYKDGKYNHLSHKSTFTFSVVCTSTENPCRSLKYLPISRHSAHLVLYFTLLTIWPWLLLFSKFHCQK